MSEMSSQESTEAEAVPADSSWELPGPYFHQLLHELRTLELERLNLNGGRALSIGANGRWYFDWFERSVGPVDEHIGVEAFEEMPDDLPAYVTWNPSTADRFDGVVDESVDMVFAGQTTEHLWARELTDFLLESHRVLRPGAMLVLDSPNRLVTEHLIWSHGGHTVELSAHEISRLLEIAGFEVESRTGMLVTRIGATIYQLEGGLDRGDVAARRIRSGSEFLDDSFIWWIVARRSNTEPDREALLALTEALFWTHWPTRVARGMWNGPEPGLVVVPTDTTGPVATNLPFPLAKGEWALGLAIDGSDASAGISVNILDGAGSRIHVLNGSEAWITDGHLTWNFKQETLEFACSIEIVANAPDEALVVHMPLDLRCVSGIGVRAAG